MKSAPGAGAPRLSRLPDIPERDSAQITCVGRREISQAFGPGATSARRATDGLWRDPDYAARIAGAKSAADGTHNLACRRQSPAPDPTGAGLWR